MAKPKCFYHWLIEKHIQSDGMIGKLARDMKSGGSKVTHGWKRKRNEAYLDMVGASSGMMKAFDEAWADYEVYKAGFRHD